VNEKAERLSNAREGEKERESFVIVAEGPLGASATQIPSPFEYSSSRRSDMMRNWFKPCR